MYFTTKAIKNIIWKNIKKQLYIKRVLEKKTGEIL